MAITTDNYKDIEINGRKFRVKKFDARTGSFMLMKVSALLSPMLKNIDLSKFRDGSSEPTKDPGMNLSVFNISGIMGELANVSEEDFSYIQGKCLQVCHEMLPAGPTPVLNASGNFNVIGLEEDTLTAMALTVHALIFNVKNVFTGSPLASMLGGILTTSQPSS